MSGPPAIILAAHGAHEKSDANRRVTDLARALAERVAMHVSPAFNLGAPSFAEAIDAADATSILVIPLMTSEGYFTRTVLPRRCAEARTSAGKRITIAPPVGTSPEIAAAISARARATLAEHDADPADTTIVIVGHGTRRNPDSGSATESLATRLALDTGVTDTRAVFLDADPLLEHIAPTLSARIVIVLPFLLGGGDHERRDIPARLCLPEDAPRIVERSSRRFIFEPPLLDLPELIDVIAATITEHTRPPIRLATRRSPLALRQANLVRAAIARATPRSVTLLELDPSGDLDQSTPVHALPGDAPFADVIEAALARRAADLATHSLKDLALTPDPRLPVVALLERASVDEVLVACDGATLADLPAGARIGVSCARRAAQLCRLRPDLVPSPIRGPVDRRIKLVFEEHQFDATILAAAGVERLGLERHVTQRFTLDEFAPAAGQGAIAIQARADGEAMRALGARIDHAPTRLAVEAELLLARALEQRIAPLILAAAAHVDRLDATIVLFARLISPDATLILDETVRASDPASAARAAADRLLARIPGRSAGAIALEGVA